MQHPLKSESTSLLRVLGVGFGIAMLVGNSIGGGILRMPGIVAAYTPNASIIIALWIMGGMLALAGALIYAEASAAYPITGGSFVYSEKVFGKQAGFTVGFIDWVFNLAGNSALAVAISEYVLSLTAVQWPIPLMGSIIIILLSITQWFGIQLGSAIQKTLSGLKAAGLLFLVAAFFIHGRSGHTSSPVLNLSPVVSFAVMVLALRAITFTYSGWNAPIYFSEENKQPGKSIPQSLIYGVLLLILLYVLVNAALLYIMPAGEIAHSKLAVADGATVVFGAQARTIVTVLSIVILLSGIYSGVLYIPRIIFGMARSGSFFSIASQLNRYNIPGMALLLTTLVSIAIIFSGTFEFITGIGTFLYIFVDTTVYVAILVSRWKKKVDYPFQTPAFPLLHVVMITANLALLTGLFIEDLKSCLYALTAIVITFPLYIFFKRQKNDSQPG
jgi:APA family basic amino acid/polyamine antiporter